MSRARRIILAALVATALTAAAAALSRVPYTADARAHALLRLSWRARGERVEACRTLGDSEFFALPAHMRQRQICEGGIAPYRLSVRTDSTPLVTRIVRAGDVRATRPLFVFLELPLAPGRHHVHVAFGRADSAAANDGAGPRMDDAVTGQLSFDADVELAPREIALVTYDPDRHALVLRAAGGPGGEAPTPR